MKLEFSSLFLYSLIGGAFADSDGALRGGKVDVVPSEHRGLQVHSQRFCFDDDSFRYVFETKRGKQIVKEKGCAFVGAKPKKRCKFDIGFGEKARNRCPLSCNRCGDSDDSGDDGEFVLEGDRMYVGCDAYVFTTNIKCGVFGDEDPDLCTLRTTFVGIASETGTAFVGDTPFKPFPTYGTNMDDLNPDEVCIGSGIFRKDGIKGGKMKPIPMISSDGCADNELGLAAPADYSIVIKGELAIDGSNDIKVDYSNDFGKTYYTKDFKQPDIYHAFYLDDTSLGEFGLWRRQRQLNNLMVDGVPACIDGEEPVPVDDEPLPFGDEPLPPDFQDPFASECGGIGRFQFELKFDCYSWETGWTLIDTDTDSIIEDMPSGNFGFLSSRTYLFPRDDSNVQSDVSNFFNDDSTFYCLQEGKCYTMIVTDTYGDGLTMCNTGHYRGYLDYETAFEGDGDFSAESRHVFCVGDAPEPSPEDPIVVPTTKLEVLASQPNLSRFSALLDGNKGIQIVMNSYMGTLFAPTNDAMDQLPDGFYECMLDNLLALYPFATYLSSFTVYTDTGEDINVQGTWLDENLGQYVVTQSSIEGVLPCDNGNIIVVNELYLPSNFDTMCTTN